MELTAAKPRPDPSGQRPQAAIPVRTCVGCRQRDRQSSVMRVVVRSIDGAQVAVLDARRRLPGRGAWVHPDPACMEMSIKRKAFSRAFRGPVDTAQLVRDLQAHLERSSRSTTPPSSLKAGQNPHGNSMSTQR